MTEEKMSLGIKHKDRLRIESKVSKQTIELGEDLNEMITKQKVERDPVSRFPKR